MGLRICLKMDGGYHGAAAKPEKGALEPPREGKGGRQGLEGLGEGQGEQGLHSGEELGNPCRVQLLSWFLAWAGRQSMAVGIQAVCATQNPGSAGDLVTRVGGGGRGHPFLCAPTACCPTPKIYLGVQSVGEASALCSNSTPQMSSPPHRPAPGMAEQKKECFLETQTWVQIWSLPLCPSG